MKHIFSLFFMSMISSFGYAADLPASLKQYSDSKILGTSWVCGNLSTVEAGEKFKSADVKTKRIIVGLVKESCKESIEQITFQTHSPFKNVGRWTAENNDYKDL